MLSQEVRDDLTLFVNNLLAEQEKKKRGSVNLQNISQSAPLNNDDVSQEAARYVIERTKGFDEEGV